MSHYLPAYTRQNGRRYQAACGQYVEMRAHSAEPTCETCRLYVLAEADTDASMAELAAEADVAVRDNDTPR